MRVARITAFLLVCVLAATAAGGALGKSRPKPVRFAAKYDCAKIATPALFNSFFGSWEGNVVLKGKSVKNAYSGGGGSSCTYTYASGPFAGKYAGSVVVVYGPPAAGVYKSDEHTAKHNGAQACAEHPNTTGDPRVCGPVELTGIGTHAYEAFAYIAAMKAKFFVQVAPGPGVANGQYIPSSTLPPTGALEGAAKAILAKLH